MLYQNRYLKTALLDDQAQVEILRTVNVDKVQASYTYSIIILSHHTAEAGKGRVKTHADEEPDGIISCEGEMSTNLNTGVASVFKHLDADTMLFSTYM